jgi:hypothetical protein
VKRSERAIEASVELVVLLRRISLRCYPNVLGAVPPPSPSACLTHTHIILHSFGVVNLATYQGNKVAMKQLLTVNQENVLRFRHECFLMKNLSHPNVVKLVGVVWDEDM